MKGKQVTGTINEIDINTDSGDDMDERIIVNDSKIKRSQIELCSKMGFEGEVSSQVMILPLDSKKWTSGEPCRLGPPRQMSVLSWNCHRLGQPRTIQMLEEWAKCKKPIFIFLIETLCNRNKLESLKKKLGYEGDNSRK